VTPPVVVTIDVAHPPMSADAVETNLDDLLRRALLSGRTRVVRIIHGYGSGGKGGTLKTTVRNWAYRRRERFEMVMAGEEYSPFDNKLQDFLKGAGDVKLADFSGANEGMTFLLLPGD